MRKLTTEEFISKARMVHGDKYIYDKSVYTGSNIKIVITCPYHGDFLQSPHGHIMGKGCINCGGSKRATTEEFVAKAMKLHGDRYDYALVNYTNNSSKVSIICKTHGVFEQRPYDHLNGKGCFMCYGTPNKTTEEFIVQAKLLYCDKYDYSLVKYNGAHQKVSVICIEHGPFMVTPSNHLNHNRGCPKCGRKSASNTLTLDTEDFIRRARIVHGCKYDYSSVEYINTKNKVKIRCSEHGYFWQKANYHITGNGCPSCAKTGFDSGKNGFVYFLISGELIKVGITNKLHQRIRQLKSSTPFDFNLIHKIKTDGVKVREIEKYYHNKYESAGLTGFDGATEWLKYSPELMNEIMNKAP
ncbi:endonuclease [Klebsiella phage VLCpiS13f]|uniref:endonuclease n=1 Tax=Klebsiella phage VLCpiS13f TaxID=2874890 RepID=UPI00233EF240|nr:endonuclease [Klebsiella phage VLCpiS13f]UVX29516.1 endonuclease [Klebsiella phage VLCpiS13f]